MTSRTLDAARDLWQLVVDPAFVPDADFMQLSELALADATKSVLRAILDLMQESGRTDADLLAQSLDALRRLRGNSRTGPNAAPALSSPFLALIALSLYMLNRRISRTEDSGDRQCPKEFVTSLIELGLGSAIRMVYHPDRQPDAGAGHGDEAGEDSRRQRIALAWASIDFATLEVCEFGTTSVIFRFEERATKIEKVIKCVLFPWAANATVASSTAAYFDTYASAGEVVVRADASTPWWIVMPFHPGVTLATYIDERLARCSSPKAKLVLAREVTSNLLAALDALAKPHIADTDRVPLMALRPSQQHLDLSPRNVMVGSRHTSAEAATYRFIDLGRNYLYTRQAFAPEHDDAIYVSPEVRDRAELTPFADLYSVAIIANQILSYDSESKLIDPDLRSGRVPDSVFELTPVVAAPFDDFLERSPEKRLLLYSPNPRTLLSVSLTTSCAT